jgi:hypothetical protein
VRRSLGVLLGKELQQHGTALAGVGALLCLGLLIDLWQLSLSQRVLSNLELAGRFARVPLLLAALYLGHRLVVMEYYGHTQRFLETLPIRACEMEAVKFCLGLLYLLLAAAAALAVAVALSVAQEPVTARFLGIMGLRLSAYVFAVWALCFCMGFLGRARIPLYLALAAVLAALDHYTRFEFMRFGPAAMVDPVTFAFERELLPLAGLAQCVAVGAGALALALVLARLREGTLVEQLASPMSHRERAFAITLAVCAGFAAAAIAGRNEELPYRFSSDAVLRSDSGSIAIAYFDDAARPAADRLMRALEPRLDPLWQALELGEVAPLVRIARAPGERPDRMDTTHSHPTLGIVVTSNFDGEDAAMPREVTAYVVHELIAAHTRSRALLERKHWLLDGFARYWAEHGADSAPTLGEVVEGPVLRGLVAARQSPVSVTMLTRWDRVSERIGYPMADALAYLGLRVLEAEHGRGAMMSLARAVLARTPRAGVLETLYEYGNDMATVFRDSTGHDWSRFVATWAEHVDRLADDPAYAAALARVPAGTATIEASAGRGGADLRHELTLQPAAGSGDVCSFMQAYLGVLDAPVDPRYGELQERLWPGGQQSLVHQTPAVYGSGTRILAAVDCELEALGAPLRLGARRLTLP